MQIETSIYQRLSTYTALTDLVGTKIFPNVPTDNSQIPAVTYRIVSAEPQLTTAGSADLTKYMLQIDVWAFNLDTTMSAMAAVKNALHLYQGGNIHRAFLNSQNTEQAEDGYNGVLQFTVWGTTANVTATTTANAVINSGTDFITFNACSNVLRLDCTGLTLNGSKLTDSGPTNLSFTAVTNAIALSDQDSNTITLAGTSGQVWAILASGSGTPRVIVNGTVYDGRIAQAQAGDTISIRATAPVGGITNQITVRIGSASTVWNLTSANWTPASFSTATQIWLDAAPAYCFLDTAGTTACANGDPVACWKDRSGNARHFQQATTGSRPVLRLVSGVWYVEFDAVDDSLQMASAWSLTGTYSILLAELTMDTTGGARRTISSDTTNSLMSVSRNNANNIFNTSTITNSKSLVVARHTLIYSGGTSGTAKGYLDGADVTVGTPSVANWGVLRLGSYGMGSSGSESPATRVRAVVVTNTTTTTADVSNFNNWGTTA